MTLIVRTDGLVDRYFNRICSRPLTSLFLKTPLTPNAITMIAMAIGLSAAGAFAHGGYAAGILGALLFQFSCIVDCCDGEVARQRHQESTFGDLLDNTADNIVHIAIIAAIAWALRRDAQLASAIAVGAIAGIGIVASFLVMVLTVPPSPEQQTRLDNVLTGLVNRDASLVLLLLAVTSRLRWFLWLVAIGANLFWMLSLWQRWRATSH